MVQARRKIGIFYSCRNQGIAVLSPSQALDELKEALRDANKGELRTEHLELAFDNQKDFLKTLKNIKILPGNYK